MCREFSAVREHCPPENHLLFAIRLSSFTSRQSLIAIRCRFGSAGASPSQFIPSLVPRPRFKSVATKTKPAKAG
jgi:hypothetical protein